MDASIVAAPSFDEELEGRAGSPMHQTKAGNQWYFGMKAHIGVARSRV